MGQQGSWGVSTSNNFDAPSSGGRPRGHVFAARDALAAAGLASEAGLRSGSIGSGTFCRILTRSAGAGILVGLAVNTPARLPPRCPAGAS